jgi:hypothetical protein
VYEPKVVQRGVGEVEGGEPNKSEVTKDYMSDITDKEAAEILEKCLCTSVGCGTPSLVFHRDGLTEELVKALAKSYANGKMDGYYEMFKAAVETADGESNSSTADTDDIFTEYKKLKDKAKSELSNLDGQGE